MTPNEKDFHLKEFECLRKEIEYTLGEFHSVQRYAILATGAVWAWLFTQDVTTWQAWGIPFLFALLGIIRQIALFEQLRTISDYVKQLETRLDPSCLGYEHFYRPKGRRLKYAPFSNYLVWMILPVLTLIMMRVGPDAIADSVARKHSANGASLRIAQRWGP